jgi:Heavy metal binding domain
MKKFLSEQPKTVNMLKSIKLSFILGALMLAACNHSSKSAKNFHSIDTNQLAKGQAYYQCAMHPDEVSDTTTTCPVCDDKMTKHIKQ